MSREVLRDAIAYLPAKVVPALVGLIAIPVLTRLLTPEQYGNYLLVMTSLMIISSFCISWLISITIRFNVVYGVRRLYHYCRRLLMVSILTACILWLFASQLFGNVDGTKNLILAGLLWLIAHGIFEYLSGWLRARNFVMAYGIALSWKSAAGLFGSVTLLLLGFEGSTGVLIGSALAMLLALLLLPRYVLQGGNSQPEVSINQEPLNSILRYGIPAAFINLLTIGISFSDRYIIGVLMDAESVAIYGANYDLAEKTIFFANSMLLLSSSVIGFRIFEQEGEAKAADFLSRLMRLYLFAAPPLIVVLAIFSDDIVSFLLPERYQTGALILPIVAAAGLFVGIMHRYSLVLSFHKRTDTIMWCSATVLLVNLISCALLIPKFGIFGAAMGTVIAYASWLIFIRLAATKYLAPVFPWLTLFRVGGALSVTAVAMIGILQVELNEKSLVVVLSIFVGFFSYILALYFLKEITKKDIQVVISTLSGRFYKV